EHDAPRGPAVRRAAARSPRGRAWLGELLAPSGARARHRLVRVLGRCGVRGLDLGTGRRLGRLAAVARLLARVVARRRAGSGQLRSARGADRRTARRRPSPRPGGRVPAAAAHLLGRPGGDLQPGQPLPARPGGPQRRRPAL
ncbi:MAG: hypothetical protein AVDCRST_MAG61-612, partial [uncultured Friedmanniella sp.]